MLPIRPLREDEEVFCWWGAPLNASACCEAEERDCGWSVVCELADGACASESGRREDESVLVEPGHMESACRQLLSVAKSVSLS